MADLMAIVSKAVFEKDAGKDPKVGTALGMERYISANKNLEPLSDNGRLYLVTVRPPDEKLWLVAVLEKPKFDGKQWKAKASTTPITDISKLRSKLKFESGKGITAAAGALGMSLQTPRALTAADTKLLDAAVGSAPAAKPAKPGKDSSPGIKPAPSGVAPEGAQKSALLATILGDPDNVDARRVYADILTTHNDRRGEFILLELALLGRLSIRKRGELAKRRDELYKQYAKTWFGYKGQFAVRGGFIYSYRTNPKGLGITTAKLFETEPVTNLQLQVGADDAAQLGKSLWPRAMQLLSLTGRIKDEAFATLVALPELQGLRSLNATHNGLTKVGVKALVGHLPALQSLALTANSIGDDAISSLVQWKGLASLDTLYLSKCGLTVDGVARLLAKPLPKLETLALRGNDFDDDIAATIVKLAKSVPNLRLLELNNTEVSDAGLKKLGAALPNLVRLDARNTSARAVADTRVRL